MEAERVLQVHGVDGVRVSLAQPVVQQALGLVAVEDDNVICRHEVVVAPDLLDRVLADQSGCLADGTPSPHERIPGIVEDVLTRALAPNKDRMRPVP